MRAAAVLGLTLVLLWAIVAQVNSALAPAQVYLFAGGLFVVGPALALPPAAAGALALFAGALCDAQAPRGLFGAQALLFAGACLVLGRLRERLPREDTASRVAAVLAANLGLFLALSVLRSGRYPALGAAWLRLLADLVASEIFVGLIAPWFFALQSRALAWAGVPADRRH